MQLGDTFTEEQHSDPGSESKEVICNQTPSQITHTVQVFQAERMVKRSRLEIQAVIIGDNVAVPIPTVDRGRGDARISLTSSYIET